MKITRSTPPKPTWQPIRCFPAPTPNPTPVYTKPTPSNDVAAHAVRIASNPGSIDPRQMHN